MKKILLVLLALVAMSCFACSPTHTAAVYHEDVSQVTPAQQWSAFVLFVGWTRDIRANDPTLVCIRGHESASVQPSPWHAFNADGPYYGAYQWLQGSWNSAAAAVGRTDLIGIPPMEPYMAWYDQDAVTLEYHHMVGDGPWGNLC